MAASEPGVNHLKVPEQCQYYTLSPRNSLDGPGKAAESPCKHSDENADHNVKSYEGPGKKAVARPKKAPVRTPGKAAAAKQEARPSTPLRNRRSPDASAASTPLQAQRSAQKSVTRSLPMTPERRCREDHDEMMTNASVCAESMCSEVSGISRLTQLSRKTPSKKHLSSKEMEELEVEEKRHQVRKMIERNSVNCRKALLATDVLTAGRVQSNVKLTAPKEFHLSCPPTPRSPAQSECGEMPGWSSSASICSQYGQTLRPSTSCQSLASERSLQRSPSPLKKWKPQLTVPRGPQLNTVKRASTGLRRVMSCPPEEVGSLAPCFERPTRAATPEKRREVYQEAARTQREAVRAKAVLSPRDTVSSRTTATPARRRPESEVQKTETPASVSRQERAQRARELAQKRKDDEQKEKKEKMFVFKRSPSGDLHSPRPGPAVAQTPRPSSRPGTAVQTPRTPLTTSRQLRPSSKMDDAGSVHSVGSLCSSASRQTICNEGPPLLSSSRTARPTPRRGSFGGTTPRPCLM
eukprot:TRINITY_DN4279_c1_g1_i1.p1 TRINITY_DN4279_c1_g1~~TRINITY_DN4279_c1_g1_i1.p1  ORF type:complete len:523 (-),score=100.00 TRINITY_DN4279_c1_g1_i1:217-1785(-)